ncbi:hypothetical protein K461DRAFT_321713 [Myriangium duriaei CBS 260.36]|uniref:Mpv17/PMP22 family protein n=1 Tax=Myriangium duriaei CBS 260.36 TaxID=1168546 RepID=A0A9P4J5G7_9PEZI|nr:hypothetical protein K461DRAFT_321713 [Myriangium duriaei CBS 260.36]
MPSPMLTAVSQSTLLASLSNISAQILNHHLYSASKPFSFSLPELLRFAALNIIVAPPNFLWQAWLERNFPAYPPRSGGGIELAERGEVNEKKLDDRPEGDEGKFNWGNTIRKWVLDCWTLGAVFNTLAFLTIMGAMKGKGGEEILAAVRKDTVPIIVAGYKVWPLASFFSFTFIPWERRIVFLSFVGFLWGIYMSFVAARQ